MLIHPESGLKLLFINLFSIFISLPSSFQCRYHQQNLHHAMSIPFSPLPVCGGRDGYFSRSFPLRAEALRTDSASGNDRNRLSGITAARQAMMLPFSWQGDCQAAAHGLHRFSDGREVGALEMSREFLITVVGSSLVLRSWAENSKNIIINCFGGHWIESFRIYLR